MCLAMMSMVPACSAGSDIDHGDSGACALEVRYDGRVYVMMGVKVLPTYGAPLGTAVVEPCEPEEPGGWGVDAVELAEVSPRVAFGSPDWGVFFAEDKMDSLPPEAERLLHEPACQETDVPIGLKGPWLGIIEPDGTTELDLVPPYDLTMQVEEASSPTYERTFLTIHVGQELGQPLSREDVDAFLLKDGDLSVTARCIDGEFWAERVAAHVPA